MRISELKKVQSLIPAFSEFSFDFHLKANKFPEVFNSEKLNQSNKHKKT